MPSTATEAKFGNSHARVQQTQLGSMVTASANLAEASAKAALVENVIEAKARAVVAEVRAGAAMDNTGAHAGAYVTTAKVEAGLTNVPLAQVSATGPEVKAEVGVSQNYAGGSVGAYAGEVRAGPFAARAGVKFGAGLRNGVPEVDLGLVTVPCSIM